MMLNRKRDTRKVKEKQNYKTIFPLSPSPLFFHIPYCFGGLPNKNPPNLGARRGSTSKKMPRLEEFVEKRDYTGAITLLEFKRSTGEEEETTLPWLGYCAFHAGDYQKVSKTIFFFLLSLYFTST